MSRHFYFSLILLACVLLVALPVSKVQGNEQCEVYNGDEYQTVTCSHEEPFCCEKDGKKSCCSGAEHDEIESIDDDENRRRKSAFD